MTSATRLRCLAVFFCLLVGWPAAAVAGGGSPVSSIGMPAPLVAGQFLDTVDGAVGRLADWAEAVIFYSVPVKGQGLPIILLVLGSTAVFLTIYFRFVNLRAFGVALGTVRGRYTDADAAGQITHFQALTAALSATVGLGNIAGVAVAVSLGGPGATFWMILMGICGMTTKFCECTLGVRFRQLDEQGRTYGGAMYYLSRGLRERGLGGLGAVMAVFFAVMCVGGALGAGNMFQVNQATEQFTSSFGVLGDKPWAFGVILAILVALVIIGGIVWIARVTALLVPFMCITYVAGAIVILFTNVGEIVPAIGAIVTGAFSPEAVGGGIVGVLIQGIKRAAFSNEAGIGSAPIAHSAVKTNRPASEGLVALLEPFVDTVVVCTMTALVLVITGTWRINAEAGAEGARVLAAADPAAEEVAALPAGQRFQVLGRTDDAGWLEVRALDPEQANRPIGPSGWLEAAAVEERGGIQITSMAFETVIGGFKYLLSVAVILFAFSTMISWSYYGEQAVIYLFGRRGGVILAYKVLFCLVVIVGASASLGNVIRLSDAMIFAMAIPNLLGLYLLLPVVRSELEDYLGHVRRIRSGE